MLRTHRGTAPVTKRSGKRLYAVHMRYACNHGLRHALYHWARCSLPLDPATRAYYDASARAWAPTQSAPFSVRLTYLPRERIIRSYDFSFSRQNSSTSSVSSSMFCVSLTVNGRV